MSDPADLLTAALAYRARGWSIIPIGRDKRPAVKAWKGYQTRRADDGELREWFSATRVTGLAVVCGAVSGGLVVRDYDVADGYHRWAAKHGDLARVLPTVETGRGFHVYIRNGCRGIRKQIDGELRGGGYVLLPPSLHPSGRRYTWLIELPDGELAEVDPQAVGLADLTDDDVSHSSVSSVLRLSGKDKERIQKAVLRAVETTIPAVEGERNECLFRFARTLKGVPELAGLPFADLRLLVEAWHRRALPIIGTKSFDETWSDFVHGWSRVKHPARSDFMMTMMARADALPLPATAERYDERVTRRLVALCAVLQQEAGDRPFILSCRTAAELLGTDRDTAWRRLHMLEADGVIRVVEPGTERRAVRYRYVAGGD